MDEQQFRSGFVAIIGRPNVGKSTLLNHLVGQKVAIMSDKPQTTRNRIMGVVHGAQWQVVFLDTPGIHKPQHKLGEHMVETASRALDEVEAVVFMVDGTSAPGAGDRYITRQLSNLSSPIIVAVNKLDQLSRGVLAERLLAYSQLIKADEYVPLSALTGENTDVLLELIVSRLPEGPVYFPEGMVTDQPERFVVAELIREKILELTREEVPHSVGVIIEELLERDNGMLYINATVYVERDSQKAIIIGHGGSLLKEVGKRSRRDIEALLGIRCYLDIWVKVRRNWRNKEVELRRMGYIEE